MSASQRFYGKINWGQVSRLLYRGCPLFGGSVIRGFTVYCVFNNVVSASSKQFIEYILNSSILVGMQCSFSVLAAVMQYNCLCFCR